MQKLIAIILVAVLLQSCKEEKINNAVITSPIDNSASIVVLVDKSLSVQDFGIPAMNLNDFNKFIEYIHLNSGTFAASAIGENSDRVMVTLTIEKAPIAPKKPRREDYKSTVFLNKNNKYKTKLLPEYEAKKAKWDSITKQKIQRFKSALEALLNEPYNQRKTDIFNGLNRANVVHNSSNTNQHLTIILSDGIDDVGNPLREITGDVALVFGTEQFSKELKKLPKFKRFETLEMAMQILN